MQLGVTSIADATGTRPLAEWHYGSGCSKPCLYEFAPEHLFADQVNLWQACIHNTVASSTRLVTSLLVDGWSDALHEDVCRQPLSLLELFQHLLAIQVVTAALSLRLQHIQLRVLLGLPDHLLRLRVFYVIKAPKPCM